MATYSYKCLVCLERFEYPTNEKLLCPNCFFCNKRHFLKRDYRSDGVAIAAVPQSTYVPSLGMEISDQRQVDERLKVLTEDSFNRVGYEPRLRARHPSELASDPGYAEAAEQSQRSSRDASA